jgi:hypothetical protein
MHNDLCAMNNEAPAGRPAVHLMHRFQQRQSHGHILRLLYPHASQLCTLSRFASPLHRDMDTWYCLDCSTIGAAVLMQVLAGQPASALAAVQQADAEVYVDSKPKMPIKGQRNILVSWLMGDSIRTLEHWQGCWLAGQLACACKAAVAEPPY